jgi:uncharacterized protein (DUF1778 family)
VFALIGVFAYPDTIGETPLKGRMMFLTERGWKQLMKLLNRKPKEKPKLRALLALTADNK